MIIARYYFGLLRRRVKTYLEPVYGPGPDMIAKIARDNPANLLSSTGLQAGELAIYVNYPGRDNYNFDAQDKSFAWLAALRGVKVDLEEVPSGHHDLPYIEPPSRSHSCGSAITSYHRPGAIARGCPSRDEPIRVPEESRPHPGLDVRGGRPATFGDSQLAHTKSFMHAALPHW